jgi:hypothetical protein
MESVSPPNLASRGPEIKHRVLQLLLFCVSVVAETPGDPKIPRKHESPFESLFL